MGYYYYDEGRTVSEPREKPGTVCTPTSALPKREIAT